MVKAKKSKEKVEKKSDLEERKNRVEEEIKPILEREGLGFQPIIITNQLGIRPALVFVDLRAEKNEEVKPN